MTVTEHITITEDERYRHRLTFIDDDGNPDDVTGRTYAAQVRTAADGTLLGAFSVDTTSAATGEVWLELADADVTTVIAQLAAAETAGHVGNWEVWDTTDGKPTPLIRGRVTARRSVTEP